MAWHKGNWWPLFVRDIQKILPNTTFIKLNASSSSDCPRDLVRLPRPPLESGTHPRPPVTSSTRTVCAWWWRVWSSTWSGAQMTSTPGPWASWRPWGWSWPGRSLGTHLSSLPGSEVTMGRVENTLVTTNKPHMGRDRAGR